MAASRKIEIALGLTLARFRGAVKEVERGFMRMIRSGQTYRKTLDDLNGHADHLRTSMLQLAGVVAGGAVFGAAARGAFGFNQTLEQSRIGIAALVRTFQDVDMEGSFGVAEEIQKRLQIAGLKTTATYEELLKALQEGIGPALRENFNPEQIVAFTSSMTQAAAALSLPMDQLGQELRAVLDGTIDRNARIAKALQLDNATIKQWKDAGILFEKLQDRLQAFSAAGDQAAETFGGAFSNMTDAVQMALGQGTTKIFAGTTRAIKSLTAAIVTIDEEAGTFTFNKKIMAAMDGIDSRVSSFLRSVSGEDIAMGLESLVKTVGVLIDAFVRVGGAVVGFTRMFGPLLPVLAAAGANFLLIAGGLKLFAFALVEPFRIIKGFSAALTVLTGLDAAGWLAGLGRAAMAARSGVIALAATSGGMLATLLALPAAAGFAAVSIGRLVKQYRELKEIEARTAAQEVENAAAQKELAARFAEISSRTGVVIKSREELNRAVNAGRLRFDESVGAWVSGSEKMAAASKESMTIAARVTGAALEEMKRKYREYAGEVKRIQAEISGREKSLAEELRALGRSGMSDLGAWQDRRKEAEEYGEAARKAMEAGDFKEAVGLADKARAAFADLNKEVKDGDRLAVSRQEGLRAAMAGVESAGNLAVAALRKQEDAAHAAMEELSAKSGFQDLGAGMDAAEKKWLDSWYTMKSKAVQEIDAVEDRLKAIKDREVTVWVNEKVKRADGGPIGFRAGGRLPGFGGGDRIPALLEAGEYIIRKEAVAKFGAGVFQALNSMRVPELPAFAVGGQVGAAPASTAVHYTHDINFPGAAAPVRVRTDRQNAEGLVRELQRMGALAS